MKIYIKFAVCLAALLMLFSADIKADEVAVSDEYYDIFDMKSIEEYGDVKGIFTQLFGGDISGALKRLSPENILFLEIKSCSGLLKELLVICMLNGIAASLSFGTEKNIEYMAFTVSCVMAAGLCLRALEESMLIMKSFSSFYLGLVGAAVPAVTAALAISGRITLAGSSAALIYAASSFLAAAVKIVIIPCIGFYAVCGIVNCISPKSVLSKLTALIKKTVTLGIRGCGIVFTALMGFARAVTAGADGIAAKTAVTAVKAVPVVGDVFAAGAEGVMALVLNAKSSLAGTLIIILAVGCLVPLAKVFAMSMTFHICAALAEPLGDRHIADMIETAGGACGMVFYVMLALTLIFMGAIAVLMFGTGA